MTLIIFSVITLIWLISLTLAKSFDVGLLKYSITLM